MKSWLARALGALVLITSLAGCGGFYVGYDYVDGDPYYGDGRPAVSLAASSTVARTGDVVRLVAAASDDYRVDHVDFYSVDAQGFTTLITTVRQPPYTVDVIVPASSGGVIYFMARAVDDVGQFSDSTIVAVNVLP
jgi:hypothetical protein